MSTSACADRLNRMRRMRQTGLLILVAPVLLAACQREPETSAPAVRPVRTVTAEKSKAGTPLTFTGRIEAEDEVSLSFRIGGRLLENNGKLGDRVKRGQVVARLEPQNEMNGLRQAQAALQPPRANWYRPAISSSASKLSSRKAGPRTSTSTRQNRANRPLNRRSMRPRPSSKTAHDLVGFTELKADAPGVLTTIGPAAGEVVQPGQSIVRLARKDGRDAVFDIPAQVIRTAPSEPEISVS